MMNFFGKDIRNFLEFFWWAVPGFIRNKSISAYGGEMLLIARKKLK